MLLWEGRIVKHTKVKRNFIKTNEITSFGADIYVSKDGTYKTCLLKQQYYARITSIDTKY